MNVYVPSKGPSDWQQLLAEPDKHWRPGFSAQAVSQSWEAANGVPPEIDQLLGGNTELLLALPEHKVSLPGRGKPSQCDVFALVRQGNRTIALAIEGKVNEPFGPTIGDWLKEAKSDNKRWENRRIRLAGLSELLEVQHEFPPHLHYQLIHRAAAAVVEARRFKTDVAAMIVQSFSPASLWQEQFDEFADFLGAPSTSARLGVKPLGQELILWIGWAKGDQRFATQPLSTDADLYGKDFYAWTQQQGSTLRARARDHVDWENVAEEIESLGRSDKREIESRLKVLLVHLLKLQFQPDRAKQGWKSTIVEQRRRIGKLVQESPSLRNYPEDVLAEEYEFARNDAAVETGLRDDTFPVNCPYAIEEVLDLGYYPKARHIG